MTPQQRSNAGKAGSAVLHSAATLAKRLAAKWPELGADEQAEVRRILAEAGMQVRPRRPKATEAA